MPRPTVLVADDDASIRFVLEAALEQAGYTPVMAENAQELLALAQQGMGDAVITDVMMPGMSGLDAIPLLRAARPNLPIIVISARHPLHMAVASNQAGAFEFHAKPFDLHELMGTVARCLNQRAPIPEITAPPAATESWLIGQSAAMQELYRTIARVVDVDLTVLITGASGTGKERVARALHELSKRRHRPFVAQNMAAIPKELIESELFGHERGAFTGAAQRKAGKFELAEGGTLFLDEIGDMPLDAQTRLLRVLQEGEYIPVGGTTPKRANARIVCATHRDLRDLVTRGLFREDLYYRLQVIPIRLPLLAERMDDIPLLVAHFLTNAPARGLPHKQMTPEAVALLQTHAWPGNVRELEHTMYRLCALVADTTIHAHHLHHHLQEQRTPAAETGFASNPRNLPEMVRREVLAYLHTQGAEALEDGDLYDHMLQAMEPAMLEVVMQHTRNNQIRAARVLGINRNTLRKLLLRYGMI